MNGVPYTWDANGNLLAEGVNTYTYDHANRLVALSDGVTSYTYTYNGLGDRLQQTVGTEITTYTLDLNSGLTQVLADGTNTYLYGLSRVAQYSNPLLVDDWQYYLPDALGSVRQMADASGEITFATGYEPYGESLEAFGTPTSSYGFAGEWLDPTELLYLRARYYQPSIGSFIQPDPFEGFAALPASLHPYQYAFNNPVLYTDPSGENPLLLLLPVLLGGTAGLVGGTVIGAIFGNLTYGPALAGQCGCDMQQQALQMTQSDWTAMHALSGGIVGGVAGAITGLGPGGLIIVSGVGVVISAADIYNTYQIFKNETGPTACIIGRGLLGVAGIVFGGFGIAKGVRVWQGSGRGLGWFTPVENVPGGSLSAHEVAGGHTIARHVGQTEAQLQARLRTTNISAASSFFDQPSAELTIARAINANQKLISSWLQGNASTPLRFEYSAGQPTGIYLARGASNAIEVTRVQIVLFRDPSLVSGYRIQTSFPIP